MDPLGGAPFVEALTDELEARAQAYIDQIDGLGGAVSAIDQGFVQREIMASAYEHQKAVEAGRAQVVGVNVYEEEEAAPDAVFKVDERIAEERAERVAQVRAGRNAAAADDSLAALVKAARGGDNLFLPVRACVEARVTLGEICGALETVFGKYREVSVL